MLHIITYYLNSVCSYRLAPEHPFPAPFEDCLKVTNYLLQNGGKFRIDKNKIGLAGEMLS